MSGIGIDASYNGWKSSGGGGAPAAPTAINKSLGDASGGTVVIITHPNTTGLTGAKVCGVALTSFSIVDSTHVQGTTAAMTASATPGDVKVTNASGDSPALAGVFEAFAWTNLTNNRLSLRGDNVTLDGFGNVQTMSDQSPQMNHATQATPANRPAPTTLAGKAAVGGFNAGSISLASTSSIFATAGSARTWLIVCQDTSSYPIVCERTGDPCQYVGSPTSTIVCGDETNGAQNITLSAAPPLTTPRWMIVKMTGAGNVPVVIYKNQGDPTPTVATVSSGVQGTESGAAGYAVGKSAFGSFYGGKIAEIGAIEHAVSAGEITRIEAYLADRYAI